MYFRHYDQAGLDAQYQVRPYVPDLDDIFSRWERRSEETRNMYECRVDVPYGDKPLEKMDIFPGSKPGSPIQVFIHGGYWAHLDKRTHSFIAAPFVAAGHAFVAINYTLAPAASMDDIVLQCRNALAWIGYNAGSFNGDASRIHISGHSAGGHLVGMMMAKDWPSEGQFSPDFIKSCCAISGLFDLEPIRLCYVNEKLQLKEEEVERNSPIFLMPRGKMPIIVAVGADEQNEYLRQSSEYFNLLRKNGHDAEYLAFSNQHHFQIVEEFGLIGSDLSKRVLRNMSRL